MAATLTVPLSTMLLRTLPDFASAHAETRHSFNAKWGRENCIIWGRARRAKFGPCAHGLSIRAAWGGEERCQFDGRTVAVDDDSFLILNNGRVCTTQIDSAQPVESFAIYLGPGLVEHAYGAMTLTIEKALERGDAAVERSAEFLETLQPHDKLVSPVLRYIRLHVLRGVDDEAWYDEQLTFLLERMLAHRDGVLARVDSFQINRAATRREIHRRVSLATDYLHSNYRQAARPQRSRQGGLPVEVSLPAAVHLGPRHHAASVPAAQTGESRLAPVADHAAGRQRDRIERRIRAAPCAVAPDAPLDRTVAPRDPPGRIARGSGSLKKSIAHKENGGGFAAPPPLLSVLILRT